MASLWACFSCSHNVMVLHIFLLILLTMKLDTTAFTYRKCYDCSSALDCKDIQYGSFTTSSHICKARGGDSFDNDKEYYCFIEVQGNGKNFVQQHDSDRLIAKGCSDPSPKNMYRLCELDSHKKIRRCFCKGDNCNTGSYCSCPDERSSSYPVWRDRIVVFARVIWTLYFALKLV